MLMLSEAEAQVTLGGGGVPMTGHRSIQSFCVSCGQASNGCCISGKYIQVGQQHSGYLSILSP